MITGATSLEQMLQNVTAATWTLTQTELDAVNTILEHKGRTRRDDGHLRSIEESINASIAANTAR